MPRILPREMTVRCEATSLTISSEGIESARCRSCDEPLDIHQPNERYPEHLLGTCPTCSAWYLIEVTRDGTEAFLVNLPTIALIREALAVAEKESMEKKGPSKRKKPATNARKRSGN